MNNQICKRCVLDNTVPNITFDDEGVCHFCRDFDVALDMQNTLNQKEENTINSIVRKIKSRSNKKGSYDCIIGMSGGVDSTYLAYLAKKIGLNPLAVHVDAGWNSEIAVANIENATSKLNIDLETIVIDWLEMKDLQRSYFLASVKDCDVPQDHAFVAAVYKCARRYNIKTVLSGHNFATEHILPTQWVYDSNDLANLKDIHAKYGQRPLKTYPTMGYIKRGIINKYIARIQSVRLLNFIDYKKEDALEIIKNELGWRSYGDKHHESIFTKMFQSYYLPVKFNIDKRKAHLSNLILNNEISRNEALEILSRPPYDEDKLSYEISYLYKKLGFTEEEWNKIMKSSPVEHEFFKQDKNDILYRALLWIQNKKKKIFH